MSVQKNLEHWIGAPGSLVEYDQVCSEVVRCVAETLSISPERVGRTTVLLELGAQSFDFVYLAFRLERAYKIEMPRRFLAPDVHTIDSIVCAVISERRKTRVL